MDTLRLKAICSGGDDSIASAYWFIVLSTFPISTFHAAPIIVYLPLSCFLYTYAYCIDTFLFFLFSFFFLFVISFLLMAIDVFNVRAETLDVGHLAQW